MTEAAAAERRKWLALVLLASAQFVVVLDASIVNVALPSIGQDLRVEQGDLSWVVNAYVLCFGGFLLLGGRMADLLGRRRIFIAGRVLFSAGSLAGGFATDLTTLIVARAAQGLPLVARGLDPKSLTAPEVGHAELSDDYAAAIRAYASGTPEGVATWIGHCAAATAAAARDSQAICEAFMRG